MIETSARVTRVVGETAWVRVESPSSCGACGGKGCGSSIFARLWHPREPEYPLTNHIAAQVGEPVVLGIEDGALLRAAIAGYLLPLALLLAGAIAGARWGDGGAVAGAVLGLVLAAVWRWRRRAPVPAAILLRRGASACHPEGIGNT